MTLEVKKSEQPGRLNLEFTIHEGPRVKVKVITIRGNTVFTAKEIKKQMALQDPGFFTSQPFQEDLLERDVENIRNRYLDAGYLSSSREPEHGQKQR